jgi:hypothetical protein
MKTDISSELMANAAYQEMYWIIRSQFGHPQVYQPEFGHAKRDRHVSKENYGIIRPQFGHVLEGKR